LEDKAQTVQQESEELMSKIEEFREEKENFNGNAYRIHQLSLANNEESEEINLKKLSLEQEREELDRMRYEVEAEKAHVKTEIVKNEEFKRELDIR
jgi:hypothetical protein